MSNDLVRKSKWFWAWQDDKEEEWLSEMSRQGLHLQRAYPFGQYLFMPGEPADFAYRLDYIPAARKDESYFQLFRDAGWEHVGEMTGWQYWRRPATNSQADEIFSDPESKVLKYRRLLAFLVVFLPLLIFNSTRLGSIRPDEYSTNVLAVQIFMTVLMVLYAYAILRIIIRIGQLKRK